MKFNLKAFMFLLALASVGLVSCAKKESAKTSEGITFKGEISVQAEKEWVGYYTAAAKRVMKAHPQAKINIIEASAFDHLDRLDQTSASNPDIADVFAFPADRLYGLNNSEVLSSIDAEGMAQEIGGWEDFENGLGGRFKVDGNYLAFPYNIETLVAFINKANADRENVDLTKLLEFSEMASPDHILVAFFNLWFGVSATNAANFELLSKNGTQFFTDMTKDFKDLTKGQQEVLTKIFEYWNAHYKAGSSLFDKSAGYGYMDEQFKTGGKCVAAISGPWDQAKFMKLAGAENLQIAELSKITIAGKPLTHWRSGWGLGINSRIEQDANKMAIAKELIKELINPKYAVDLFKATGKLIENATADIYTNSDLDDAQKFLIGAVYSSYETAIDRPLFAEWGRVWDTWENGILAWNAAKPTTVEDAYKELQASFKAMMENF